MLRLLIYITFSVLSVTHLCAQDQQPPHPGAARHGADTLKAQVSVYDKAKLYSGSLQKMRPILNGNTHDLKPLNVFAFTYYHGSSHSMSDVQAPLPYDQLLIIRDGSLSISVKDTVRVLGPGGVALLPSGTGFSVSDSGNSPVTFYLFRFHIARPPEGWRSRHAAAPFLIDWPEMTMKKTDKGETRQIFSQPVTWLTKIDMHATTLNPGEVSHPPHTHRTEEIILLRSGHVQMHIGDNYYPASGGDLVFLSSGIPHALENRSDQRCEYFALQWNP